MEDQLRSVGPEGSVWGDHPAADLVTDARFAVGGFPPDLVIAVVEGAGPVQPQFVSGGSGGVVQRSVQPEPERTGTGEPEDDHLIREAREHLAAECRVVHLEVRDGDGVLKVEPAPVGKGGAAGIARQMQCSRRLVALAVVVEEIFLNVAVGVGETAVGDQPAGPKHLFGPVFQQGLIRQAGPEGILVEFKRFFRRSAEDHRADPAVADRQRALPVRRRRGIPKLFRIIHDASPDILSLMLWKDSMAVVSENANGRIEITRK